MEEHVLEDVSHIFKIGEKKISMAIPSLGQQMDFMDKMDKSDDSENLKLMMGYFKELGVGEKDFKALTVGHMQAMLKVVNEVPK